jgi:hypothetical protein
MSGCCRSPAIGGGRCRRSACSQELTRMLLLAYLQTLQLANDSVKPRIELELQIDVP